jgi:hypothetical protein
MNLARIDAHQLGLVVAGAVFPSEGHLSLLHRDQTLVGDGGPMGITAEVSEDLLRAGKGRFTVDDPILSGCLAESIRELGARAVHRTVLKPALELLEEFGPKDPGQYPDRKQKPGLGRDPSRPIRVQASSGDDAVQVRVIQKRLRPGVQDG